MEEVGALSSGASLLEEASPGAVCVGARAMEALHAFGDQRLAVEIQGPQGGPALLKELEAAVEASPCLRTTAGGGDVRVYFLPARDGAAADDPVPQARSIVDPSWAAVGLDGRLVMPIHGVDEPGVDEVVVANLETVARYRRALALANPDPGATLRTVVDLVLMRRENGSWVDAVPGAGGGVVFEEGEPIAFRISNGFTAPIFVSVLDFGLTGRIAQVHPAGGVADRIDPGMAVRVGDQPGCELPLAFPRGFPFARDPGETDPAQGNETLKLVATTARAVSFDPLLQEGVRGAGRARRSRVAPGCAAVRRVSGAGDPGAVTPAGGHPAGRGVDHRGPSLRAAAAVLSEIRGTWMYPQRAPEPEEGRSRAARDLWRPGPPAADVTEDDDYVVVDDRSGGTVTLVVAAWPSLDAVGRLVFPDFEGAQRVVTASEAEFAGAVGASSVRVGDVFRLRGTEGEPSTWRDAVDVTAQARAAAKAALYGAVTTRRDERSSSRGDDGP